MNYTLSQNVLKYVSENRPCFLWDQKIKESLVYFIIGIYLVLENDLCNMVLRSTLVIKYISIFI